MRRKNSRRYPSRRRKGRKLLRISVLFTVVLLLCVGALFAFAWWGRHLGEIVGTGGTTAPTAETSVGGESTQEPTSDVILEPTTDGVQSSGGRVYLPLDRYTSRQQFEDDVNSARKAGFSEAIIDLKDASGRIYFNSESEVAASCGAVKPNPELVEMSELTAYLRANSLKVYGRVSVFADDLAALTFPEYTLMRNDGERYYDLGGHWTSVYSRGARDYALQVLSEAASLGLDGILLDRFYLPVTDSALKLPEDGPTRTEMVTQFVSEARRALDEVSPGIVLALYLPVEAQGKADLTGADGQALVAVADAVLTSIPAPN